MCSHHKIGLRARTCDTRARGNFSGQHGSAQKAWMHANCQSGEIAMAFCLQHIHGKSSSFWESQQSDTSQCVSEGVSAHRLKDDLSDGGEYHGLCLPRRPCFAPEQAAYRSHILYHQLHEPGCYSEANMVSPDSSFAFTLEPHPRNTGPFLYVNVSLPFQRNNSRRFSSVHR